MNLFAGTFALSSLNGWWSDLLERGSDTQGYENLTGNALFSVPLIVIAVFFGIAIALCSSVFTKRVLGGMVRKLLAEEALSSDSAKTLDELGFRNHLLLRFAVKGNVSLRRVVACREEEEFLQKQAEARLESKSSKKIRTKVFRVDSKAHHFYILAEQRDAAATKFEKKGTSFGALWILLILLFVLMIVVLASLPRLMNWLDQLVGMVNSGSSSNGSEIV